MEFVIRPAAVTDKDAVLGIFNYFTKNSFAVYSEDAANDNFYVQMVESIGKMPYLVVEARGKVIGFGFAKPYFPNRSFARTAVLTYFILPEFTGIGIGSSLFESIVAELKKLGVDTLLANISHLNEQSVAFHKKMGFFECGRFRRVCRKNGRDVDMIWMEKMI
jgi:phosphinothricin acetyltransferase